MEGRYPFHPRCVGVRGGPLAEEDGAFLFDFGIGNGVCCCKAEAFEEGFVGEGSLEPGPGVLDEAVKYCQGTELLVDAAIFAAGLSEPDVVSRSRQDECLTASSGWLSRPLWDPLLVA